MVWKRVVVPKGQWSRDSVWKPLMKTGLINRVINNLKTISSSWRMYLKHVQTIISHRKKYTESCSPIRPELLAFHWSTREEMTLAGFSEPWPRGPAREGGRRAETKSISPRCLISGVGAGHEWVTAGSWCPCRGRQQPEDEKPERS